jgi:hypothetical protein
MEPEAVVWSTFDIFGDGASIAAAAAAAAATEDEEDADEVPDEFYFITDQIQDHRGTVDY